MLAEQKIPHRKPAKDCRFSELSVWVSGLDSNCRHGHSLLTLNQKERVDLMAWLVHQRLQQFSAGVANAAGQEEIVENQQISFK